MERNWIDICGTSGDLGNEYKCVVNYILTVDSGGLVFLPKMENCQKIKP